MAVTETESAVRELEDANEAYPGLGNHAPFLRQQHESYGNLPDESPENPVIEKTPFRLTR